MNHQSSEISMQNHREAMDAAMSNPISTNATDLLAEFIGGSIELFGANPESWNQGKRLNPQMLRVFCT